MKLNPEAYFVTDSVDEYHAAIHRTPLGPCGPLGPLPMLFVPMRPVETAVGRRPAPRLTRLSPSVRFATFHRDGSRAVTSQATPPKKCAACGTLVATPWLLWNVCKCGRVRPPTPREEAARLRLRLAAAGA